MYFNNWNIQIYIKLSIAQLRLNKPNSWNYKQYLQYCVFRRKNEFQLQKTSRGRIQRKVITLILKHIPADKLLKKQIYMHSILCKIISETVITQCKHKYKTYIGTTLIMWCVIRRNLSSPITVTKINSSWGVFLNTNTQY